MKDTDIKVSPETKKRLHGFGIHGETYNIILNRLMDQAEKLKALMDQDKRIKENLESMKATGEAMKSIIPAEELKKEEKKE